MNNNQKPFADMLETELVQASMAKREGAVVALLKQNERLFQGMVHRLAPDAADVPDILQEVSIRVWKGIHRLKDPLAFRPWVKQIITHIFYDILRKRPRNFQIISMDEPLMSRDGTSSDGTRDIADEALQPQDAVLCQELAGQIESALALLTPAFRTAVILRDLEGLTYEQIATITKSELGTVKSRICRARIKAQKTLISCGARAAA